MSAITAAAPQIFEPDYYQRLYDVEEQHWWAVGMRNAMNALLKGPLQHRQSLRVLDVGCGTGYLLTHLDHYSLASEPVGIDISPHALQFCRRRGASSLAVASATDLPFVSESFDLIICIDTVQHISGPGADRKAVEEFARLLAPEGVLYIRTNSARGHAPLRGADPDQYRRYNLSTMTEILLDAGLQVERATYLNMLPGLWAMFRERLRRRSQSSAAIGPGLAIRPYSTRMHWLNRLMRGVPRVESWFIGAMNVNLPFGHSTAFVARRLPTPSGGVDEV